jgi:hypothetical protein
VTDALRAELDARFVLTPMPAEGGRRAVNISSDDLIEAA